MSTQKGEQAFYQSIIKNLQDENLQLRSEVSYLKGKIEVYERFLKKQGFIKGDEE